MNLGLPWQKCNLPGCLVRERLLRCGACGIAVYCGAEHQIADRLRHKASCGLVKQTREKLREEKTAAGELWQRAPTSSCIRAHFDAMLAALNIRTGEAVDAALAHAFTMLRLAPLDESAVHGYVPAMYLRLGRDQAAYDFVKWWAVAKPGDDRGWHDTALAGDDVLEPLQVLTRLKGMIQLSMIISMVLLKMRLMLDLMGLQALRNLALEKAGRLPTMEEKMGFVKEEAMSDVLLSRPDVVGRADFEDVIEDLVCQVKMLFTFVQERNQHFWQAILNPEPYANAEPTACILGSKEEVNLLFRQCWYSWAETEPAITTIRDMIRKGRVPANNR